MERGNSPSEFLIHGDSGQGQVRAIKKSDDNRSDLIMGELIFEDPGCSSWVFVASSDLFQEGEICGPNNSGRNCPALDGVHDLGMICFFDASRSGIKIPTGES